MEETIAEVAKAVSSGMNAAYAPKDFAVFEKMDQCNLMFVEQPFAPEALEAHAALAKKIVSPICLDESIRDLDSCKKALSMKSCSMVNIKPARIGSYTETIQIHDYCASNGIPLFGGGRMETGLGKIWNAHIFSLRGFSLPADFTPPLEYFSQDLVTPSPTVASGEYRIPKGIGIGCSINESALNQYTREHIVFE